MNSEFLCTRCRRLSIWEFRPRKQHLPPPSVNCHRLCCKQSETRKKTNKPKLSTPMFYRLSENSRRLWLFESLFPGSVRGFTRENSGKVPGKLRKKFPEPQDATNSRISGAGKGKPAANLGLTLPGPYPHLPCGVFFESAVPGFSGWKSFKNPCP